MSRGLLGILSWEGDDIGGTPAHSDVAHVGDVPILTIALIGVASILS
jgi:hypothetical protein